MLMTIPLSLILTSLLKATDLITGRWASVPDAQVYSFSGLSLMVIGIISPLYSRRAGFWGTWVGLWGWALMMLILSMLYLPGLSYLLLIPLLLASLGSCVNLHHPIKDPSHSIWTTVIPWLVSGSLVYPVARIFLDAMGNPLTWVVALLVTIGTSPMIPALTIIEGRRRWTTLSFGALVTLTALTAMMIQGGPPS